VIGVAINDARAVIDALADPETLYVFGVIAARTSKLGLRASDRARSTPYVTPFGLMRETSLSRDVVEAAAARLKRAGLLETLVDAERGVKAGGSARLLWPPRRLALHPRLGPRAARDRGPDAEPRCIARGVLITEATTRS
jgi:hypothetical protein